MCFIVATAGGDITTSVNKGRWARPISGLLLYLSMALTLLRLIYIKMKMQCFRVRLAGFMNMIKFSLVTKWLD